MNRALILLIVALLTVSSWAQSYRPKPGETILTLAIEGRGDIAILLFKKEAPKTTSQIIRLVQAGFYDGLRFHRVEKNPRPYLVQLGDPASKDSLQAQNSAQQSGGSGTKIPFETTPFSHEAGMVGLARTLEDKNSGDSQFYMLLAPAKFLDGNYTIFGRVVEGMDVLKKIERGDRVASAKVING